MPRVPQILSDGLRIQSCLTSQATPFTTMLYTLQYINMNIINTVGQYKEWTGSYRLLFLSQISFLCYLKENVASRSVINHSLSKQGELMDKHLS